MYSPPGKHLKSPMLTGRGSGHARVGVLGVGLPRAIAPVIAQPALAWQHHLRDGRSVGSSWSTSSAPLELSLAEQFRSDSVRGYQSGFMPIEERWN